MAITVSFIGVGNMGGALCEAVLNSELELKVLVVDKNKEKLERFLAEGCVESTIEEAMTADYVFMGVKPQVFASTFGGQPVNEESVYISMAAAINIEKLKALLGHQAKIIRIMPNTPVTVGDGVVISCCSKDIGQKEKTTYLRLMARAGLVEFMDEEAIDTLGVLTGCGPAYTFMYIDALAKAAVSVGVEPEVAKKYAIAMVKGSASYAEASSKNLEELRKNVCSPGGTTIEGVMKLEEKDLYSTVEEALKASYEKNKVLSK